MKPGDLKQKSNGSYIFQTTHGPSSISAENFEFWSKTTYRPNFSVHYSFYRKIYKIQEKSQEWGEEPSEEGMMRIDIKVADNAYKLISQIQRSIAGLDDEAVWRTPYISADSGGGISFEWDYGEGKDNRQLYIIIDNEDKWYGRLWDAPGASAWTDAGDLDVDEFPKLWLWMHGLSELEK